MDEQTKKDIYEIIEQAKIRGTDERIGIGIDREAEEQSGQ